MLLVRQSTSSALLGGKKAKSLLFAASAFDRRGNLEREGRAKASCFPWLLALPIILSRSRLWLLLLSDLMKGTPTRQQQPNSVTRAPALQQAKRPAGGDLGSLKKGGDKLLQPTYRRCNLAWTNGLLSSSFYSRNWFISL